MDFGPNVILMMSLSIEVIYKYFCSIIVADIIGIANVWQQIVIDSQVAIVYTMRCKNV